MSSDALITNLVTHIHTSQAPRFIDAQLELSRVLASRGLRRLVRRPPPQRVCQPSNAVDCQIAKHQQCEHPQHGGDSAAAPGSDSSQGDNGGRPAEYRN